MAEADNVKSLDQLALSEGSSSEEEDAAVIDWLNDKRRSGVKLVYGLFGGSNSNMSETAGYDSGRSPSSDTSHKGHYPSSILSQDDDGVDARARENFRKYFVLPETEELLAGINCGKRTIIQKFVALTYAFYSIPLFVHEDTAVLW